MSWIFSLTCVCWDSFQSGYDLGAYGAVCELQMSFAVMTKKKNLQQNNPTWRALQPKGNVKSE
jgi:hypothetical protein